MSTLAALRSTVRHPSFRLAATDMAGTSLGIAAWGLVTGVAMVKSGMPVGMAVFMSLLFDRATWLATGVAATAAIAAFALPLKLNILVAIASAVAICLVLEQLRPDVPGPGAHRV